MQFRCLKQLTILIFVFVATTAAAAEPKAAIDLTAALAAADDANIDIVTARNAVTAATAGLRSADTAPNPVLSIGAVSIRPNNFGQGGLSRQSDDVVRIDLPLERGGKRRARVASARAGIAAADYDVSTNLIQIHADVTSAYFDLMAAERREALSTALVGSYATSEKIADRRLSAGAISGGDRARQQVEALRANSALSAAQNDRRAAQLTLAILIGRERDAPQLATLGDWPITLAGTSAEPDDIADRRPDVRAAQARVEAARHDVEGARALRHPDVLAGVQYENDQRGLGSTVGFGLSVPLPVRNGYSGAVDSAGAALALAEAQAAKARAVAVADIITSRRSAAIAIARADAFDTEQLPAARRSAAAGEFAYAQGAVSLLDLLDTRRTLQAIELDTINAHADAARALAQRTAAETIGDQ